MQTKLRKNDKRDRLVNAADTLIYEQTFHTTTLADIAKMADVPLGNVYYYFKTKEAIMEAVLQKRSAEWKNLFSVWEQIPEPRLRLEALVQHSLDQSDTLARYGCMVGSLCQELGKQGGAIANGASKLMADILKWSEEQFTQIGKGDNASKLAEQFVAGIQGMTLLTLTFKEPEYMQRQSQQIREWLTTV